MDVRSVETADAGRIATVARESLAESYGHFIDEEAIETLADRWYAPERITEIGQAENVLFIVAAVDEEVVGFAEGELLQEDPPAAELDWLHVHPDGRDQGTGVQLLGQFQEKASDLGGTVLRGKVLTGNEAGRAFYEDHGFERVDVRTVSIGDEDYEEAIYEKALEERPAEAVVEEVSGPDGGPLFVNFSDAERGSKGPIYVVHESRALEGRYGFFCGNCESLDTAMDSMGRIECNRCGNRRKATRWDASYL
jgi:ribosomal protein S18 acetylase RimI-like enzyme